MIHKIIDNSIPEYVGGCFFKECFKSPHWTIGRTSTDDFNLMESLENPTNDTEKPQPTIAVFENKGDGKEAVGDEQLFGYCLAMFDYICAMNGIRVKNLSRVYVNANYMDSNPKMHNDIDSDRYQSIVLMLTPHMTQTGLIVGEEFVPYQFCRSIWFDSEDQHCAVPLTEHHNFPRLTVAYMFEKPDES